MSDKNKILGRKDILEADDLKLETVPVPEWGGSVNVRPMTGNERDEFEQYMLNDGSASLDKFRARLTAACCVDEKGKKLFTDKDIKKLGKKSSQALDRLCKVIIRINGLSVADVAELVKN